MKSIMFAIVVLLISYELYSQESLSIYYSPESQKDNKKMKHGCKPKNHKETNIKSSESINDLTFIPIYQANNLTYVNNKPGSYLSANNITESVVYTIKEDNNISYLLSLEQGQEGSWEGPIQVYDMNDSPYGASSIINPQGGIYNPIGNTNPENTFYNCFAAISDSLSDYYLGYGFATNKLTEIDPPNPQQGDIASDSGNLHRGIPDAYTIDIEGITWIVDCEQEIIDSTPVYTGNLIISRGEFNETTQNIEFEEYLLPALDSGDVINDVQIAFGDYSWNNYNGVIMLLSNTMSDPQPYTEFHPVLYQTTDGGETWTGPIQCQLGGPDGFEEIKNMIDSEILIEIFGYEIDRDSIIFNLGYHADLTFSCRGFAHINGLIAPADGEGNWWPIRDAMGTFHLLYDLSNDEWYADLLYENKTFQGEIAGFSQYNSPQVSRSYYLGCTLAFSWLDTDLEGVEENIYPDIYCVGCNPYPLSNIYTEVYNVTAFTQAMWEAYFGIQADYFFHECLYADEMLCRIPFVYLDCDPENPLEPVTHYYIDGFEFIFPWTLDCVSHIDEHLSQIMTVSQNQPNPFSCTSTIVVDLVKSTRLKIEVVDLTGRLIQAQDEGIVNPGKHEFIIDAAGLDIGLYFYKVTAGDEMITKKMIVK